MQSTGIGAPEMLLQTITKSPALATNKLFPLAVRWFGRALPHANQFPPRPVIEEAEIEESFLKGSGPGGQKIVRLV